MAATVIRNFIAKALFKKKGAIANNKSVDFSANALEQRLKNFGIDPNAIQNENQLQRPSVQSSYGSRRFIMVCCHY